jgi:serine/threonine protein kinase
VFPLKSAKHDPNQHLHFITVANWALPETPKDGRNNTSPYFESNFHILSKIGTGEFAEVWNVRDMRTGEKYAIKKTKQPFLGNSDR